MQTRIFNSSPTPRDLRPQIGTGVDEITADTFFFNKFLSKTIQRTFVSIYRSHQQTTMLSVDCLDGASFYSSADDEYDSEEPPELEINEKRLMERASDALSVPCRSVKKMTRGTNHEIFLLAFESGYKCIARLSRVKEHLGKTASEIFTLQYVKEHTNIPVPEILHYDLDPANDVGAPFVLMEKLPGRHLYKIWDGLCLDHKKAVLSQMASVLVQFASLEFDKIGCLLEGEVGPIFHPRLHEAEGPFVSTCEYMLSFVSEKQAKSTELVNLYQQVRHEIESFFKGHDNEKCLQGPYALIHHDFDGQNILFTESEYDATPRLSGVIDFEYAHTGPLYYLYEYPIFIQDVSWSKHLYSENSVLRVHFVQALCDQLPQSSEARRLIIACMNFKNFLLNDFQRIFMSSELSESTMAGLSSEYLNSARAGTGLAYSGRPDYKPEIMSDSQST